MRKAVCFIALAAPFSVPAFFDDFNGPDLEPHWEIFSDTGGRIDYYFSDGMLHVTRVYTPGEPGFGAAVFLSARLPARRFGGFFQGGLFDFDLTAVVGWDVGEEEILSVALSESMVNYRPNPPVAVMAYAKLRGQAPFIYWGFFGTEGGRLPAPLSGMHTFRLLRRGDLLEAYFDKELVHREEQRSYNLANWVSIGFAGPESAAFAPLHADFVQVVPEPATLIALAAGLCRLLYGHRIMRSLADDPGKV